jgi:hypothetical protein
MVSPGWTPRAHGTPATPSVATCRPSALVRVSKAPKAGCPGAVGESSRPRRCPSRVFGCHEARAPCQGAHAGDRQITVGKGRRARSALERRGRREVREVAAARGDGMRRVLRCPRRLARRQHRKVRRRKGGKPRGRPLRRDAAVGRAIDAERPLGSRRAKLFIARPPCPRSRRGRHGWAGTVGGARRLGDRQPDADDSRRPVTGPPEGCRWGQRRERVDYGEPERGKQEHEGKITGPDATACPAAMRPRRDPRVGASALAAGARAAPQGRRHPAVPARHTRECRRLRGAGRCAAAARPRDRVRPWRRDRVASGQGRLRRVIHPAAVARPGWRLGRAGRLTRGVTTPRPAT